MLANRARLFYLNGVGYKVSTFTLAVNRTYSFIWTEWDIKERDDGTRLEVFVFYLNGVGYKVGIWTMLANRARLFYLNGVGYKVSTFTLAVNRTYSFIWTEWDIKERDDGTRLEVFVFYLNGVGYKDGTAVDDRPDRFYVLSERSGI